MIHLVMGSRGQTFDGLDSTVINTNVPTTSENFKATGSTNQFQATAASNMTFTTIGASPSYRFTNNAASSAASTLEAGNLTLAGAFNSSGTITSAGTITGANITTSGDITSKTISSNIASGTGTTANFQNNSASATLQVLNNSGSVSNKVVANLFTPNVPSGNNSQIWYGKNQSSNSNSFALQYNYVADASNNNSLSIRAFGETNNTMEIYNASKTATTPDTSNVYIRGDVGAATARTSALALYNSQSSSNALTLLAGSSTSTYSLRFPSSIGTTNDYLQLANSGTGQLQWSSGTGGGGGSSAYIATLNRTGSQTFNFATSATVQYGTAGFDTNNTGLEYNTSGASNPYYFKNISGGTIYVLVCGNVEFQTTGSPASFNVLDLRFATSTNIAPTSGTIICTNKTGSSSQENRMIVTGIVKLQANECFYLLATNTLTSGTMTIASRIYAQVLGGSGVQSITVNPDSQIFQATSTQSGLNPTINLNLISTPSGSGTTLIRQTSPTINTPTLTSPTISGTITYTGTLTPSTVTTSGLYETSLEIDYSIAALTLTSANTKVFIFGTTGSSFTLTLPSTSTINEGDIIKIINGTTNKTITINNSSATLIDSLRPTQIAFYVCLSTSTQSWRDLGLFDRDKMEQTSNSLLLKSGVDLQLTGSSSSLVTTIQAAPSTTAFSFILPTSTGTTGQILTSGGSGQPLTWSNALPSNVPLAIDVSASYIGNSSTSSSPSLPSLIVDGLPTSSTAPVLQVRSFRTGTNTVPLHVLSPSMPTNSYTAIRIGLSEATLNSVRLNYNYSSSGSLSNTLSIALSAQPETVIFRSPNSSSPQVDVTGSIQASGDLTINNISCTNIITSAGGTITTPYITAYDKTSAFGISSTAATTNNPIVKIQGTTSVDDVPLLSITNSSSQASTSQTTLQCLSPSLPTGYDTWMRIGVALSDKNSARVGFTYAGNSSDSNFYSIGLYNQGKSVKVYKPSIAASSTTTGTLVVDGGVASTSIATNSIATSSINTSSITIGGNDYTPTSGYYTSDLYFWWSYKFGTTDPSASFTYSKRDYSWQKIGKMYSFSMQVQVNISSTSAQLHIPWFALSNHDPPVPVSGSYSTSANLNNDGWSTTLDWGLGVYIPCMYHNFLTKG